MYVSVYILDKRLVKELYDGKFEENYPVLLKLCVSENQTFVWCEVSHLQFLTMRTPLVCTGYPDYIDISLFVILLDHPVLTGLMDHWVPVSCSEFSAPVHAGSGQTLRELLWGYTLAASETSNDPWPLALRNFSKGCLKLKSESICYV